METKTPKRIKTDVPSMWVDKYDSIYIIYPDDSQDYLHARKEEWRTPLFPLGRDTYGALPPLDFVSYL